MQNVESIATKFANEEWFKIQEPFKTKNPHYTETELRDTLLRFAKTLNTEK